MKKFLCVLVALFLFFLAAPVNASFSGSYSGSENSMETPPPIIPITLNAVYDDTTDLLWFADPVPVKNISDINGYTPEGFNHNGWRIATTDEVYQLATKGFDTLIDKGFLSYGVTPMVTFLADKGSVFEDLKGIAGIALDRDGTETMVEFYGGTSFRKGSMELTLPLVDPIDEGVYGGWFVADPISTPVPAAVWLLGSGLVGVMGIRKKTVA